jgi:hypothetical protein
MQCPFVLYLIAIPARICTELVAGRFDPDQGRGAQLSLADIERLQAAMQERAKSD